MGSNFANSLNQRNLDSAINGLAKNFDEGTEYFNVLVNVFAEEFRSPQNIHLKNFHIIIPPLTINLIDHILQGKEKLHKKKPGGFFSDDGFAIGIAYILKLLDQYKQFDSLHWFEAVHNHFNAELNKLQAQVQAMKSKKEEQQTAVLTIKRLKDNLKEFELLRFSFDGARIFFNDMSAPTIPADKQTGEKKRNSSSCSTSRHHRWRWSCSSTASTTTYGLIDMHYKS